MVILQIPKTLLEITWFLIGFFAGRAGAKTDNIVKRSEWYSKLSKTKKKIVGMFLEFLHHFWIGLLLMVYATCPEMYWFGYGLFIDDLPDIPSRFIEWFKYLEKNE